ncbi:MAG TPA: dienelactone hydrolase family protein [Fimbriimonadaceae bacterium]|nr:dienelactone hydrolase family protein [Fimbriimonadaceae bacterium]
MRLFSFVLAVALSAGALAQRIETREHPYKHGTAALKGFVAYDGSTRAKRPAVIIIHDWNSIDNYEQGRARQLAQLGYYAFAADVYGSEHRPKTPQESGALAGKWKGDRAALRDRLQAALDEVKRQPQVDPNRIAVMGYCFGGTAAIELARSGAPILGAVSFHGGLDAPHPEDDRKIKAKLLVLHGAVDPFVQEKDLDAFTKSMAEAKVDMQFISYPNAVHSFTEPSAGNDPSRGAAYNASADRRSWEHMKLFFQELFRR